MELSTRALSVLREVVELYIRSGKPVASGQVARAGRLRLSPASIRSVMAGLEDDELLTRPHASAGCVPTDRSFRLYVDSLQPGLALPASTRRRLEERVGLMRRELLEDIRWVARLTADATAEAGIAVRPIEDEPVVEAISLVALGGDRVLGVVVTASSGVEKHVVRLDHEVSAAEVQQVENYLTRWLSGLPLATIRMRLEEAGATPDGAREAGWPVEDAGWLAALAEQLFAERSEAEVLFAGAERLLESDDFLEAERVRSLLEVLSDGDRLVREWRRWFVSDRTRVAIGQESLVTATGGLGMVATLFYRRGRRAGAVGVVGPRRMDYGRIVPVVEFIGETLTEMMDESGAAYA